MEGEDMKRYVLSVVTVMMMAVPFFAFASTWQMDPDHSNFQFKVKHLTVSNVKGDFGKWKGVVNLDDQNISSLKVDLTIDASSVNTGHVKRDEHLRGPDFFDVTKFPTITFASKKVTQTDTNRLKITGDLTIRGVTREVTLDVEGLTPEVKDPWGGFRRGATATGKINRKEFGLTWSKTLDSGGLVVGDEVDIYAEVEMVRK
jgi:polyisoprenoid-binding protein YceI